MKTKTIRNFRSLLELRKNNAPSQVCQVSPPGLGSNRYLYTEIVCTLFVSELKITKVHKFVFDIWSIFEKYLQIQSNTHKITN